MKPPTIKLPTHYTHHIHHWVHTQQQHKWGNHIHDKHFDKKQTSYNIALLGKLGEAAAQHIFGGNINWEITNQGDNGNDLTLKHHTALIKTNTHQGQNIHLILNTLTEFKEQTAILVQLNGNRHNPLATTNRWTIWGIISKQKFLKHQQPTNYGYGTRHYLHAQHLTHPTLYLNTYN
jgi:hypothetical protein